MGRIKTNFKCQICGRKLVIEETKGAIMFGCPQCECYVIVTEGKVKQYIYGTMFSWRRLMEDLYNTYISARQHMCDSQ